MRPILVLTAVLTLAMTTGCLRKAKPDDGDKTDEVTAAPGFPEGYKTWPKANDETVVREDEGVAREIFAKKAADLGEGTVLVKEQYTYADGAVGELSVVAVMERKGSKDGANGGWEFRVYDPATKELQPDNAACVGCHSLQADNDYLFPVGDLGQ